MSTNHPAMPLYRAKKWMLLMAILMMIAGGLAAIASSLAMLHVATYGDVARALPGVFFPAVVVAMGVLLLQAARRIGAAQRSEDSALWRGAMQKLKAFFVLGAVLLTVYFSVTVLFALSWLL